MAYAAVHSKAVVLLLFIHYGAVGFPAVLECWIIYVILVLFLLCFRARLFIDALLGKGLTSWLLIVMSNCEVVTFPLVSWVRCCS